MLMACIFYIQQTHLGPLSMVANYDTPRLRQGREMKFEWLDYEWGFKNEFLPILISYIYKNSLCHHVASPHGSIF